MSQEILTIESNTFFVREKDGCQVAFGLQSVDETLRQKPDFISVDNARFNNTLYVENNHEFGKDKPSKYMMKFNLGAIASAGVWIIKYKDQKC